MQQRDQKDMPATANPKLSKRCTQLKKKGKKTERKRNDTAFVSANIQDKYYFIQEGKKYFSPPICYK